MTTDTETVLLYKAVENDDIETVKELIKQGASPAEIVTDKTAVSLAVDEEKWEILEYFMMQDFNKTMLFEGVTCLSPAMIDYLETKYVKVPFELKDNQDIDWVNQIF